MIKKISSDVQKLAMRIVLGFVFIISGYKILFPADSVGLATSYSSASTGWISPFFVDWITNILGLDIAAYLAIQGGIEMFVGIMVLLGIFTPISAIVMALIYWAIIAASPIVGEIRLSRDVTLALFSAAIAWYGPGKYSFDAKCPVWYVEGKESLFSFFVRFGLGFTMVVSSLFFWGPMANALNSTIPVFFVFALGALLMLNIQTKWVAGLTFLFLIYAIGDTMLSKETLFKAFDGTKREIAFAAGAFLLFMIKDRDTILTPKWLQKWS